MNLKRLQTILAIGGILTTVVLDVIRTVRYFKTQKENILTEKDKNDIKEIVDLAIGGKVEKNK